MLRSIYYICLFWFYYILHLNIPSSFPPMSYQHSCFSISLTYLKLQPNLNTTFFCIENDTVSRLNTCYYIYNLILAIYLLIKHWWDTPLLCFLKLNWRGVSRGVGSPGGPEWIKPESIFKGGPRGDLILPYRHLKRIV